MTISQFFRSLFNTEPVKCQPSHEQRQQNREFSEEIESLNLESIRKQHGRLHDEFQKVIDQANIQSAYRVQKYMKLIREQLDNVDNYCIKSKRYSTKQQCVQQMDSFILEQFEKPFIKSQLNLYKVANLCLVQGKQRQQCVEQVKKQNVKSLDNGLNNLKDLVKKYCN